MNVKIKKRFSKKIIRIEGSGEIKEILLKEDFLNQKNALIQICFRGEDASGIIEFPQEEIKDLIKELKPKLKLLKGTKVMKFKK